MLTTIVDWIEAHEGILTALATIVIAVFTWALARSTKRLWKETKEASTIAKKSADAALKTAQNMEAAERAYVKMSHYPPGLVPVAASPLYDVRLRIKNFGQTPATITSVVLTHRIVSHADPLPTIPEYTLGIGHVTRRVFLVRDDEFSTYQTFTILSPEFGLIENRTSDLCIYGYVDYIDQFGSRHRAGYARRYDPRGDVLTGDSSNLHHITQPDYNYDRPRQHGEGNDWDGPPNLDTTR